MTQYLPSNLLALFAAREPVPYFPPLDKLPWEKKPWPYTGVSQYLTLFEDPKDTPLPTRGETKEERTSRKQVEKEKRHNDFLSTKLENWDPSADPKIQGDPFKTIFVGRINYDTSESKLRRELEMYGPIKRITLINSDGKPRGYAFIEYEKERDMHNAYKYADGKKIDGKRIIVDVERGRTVKSWKPRRLGGGLGGTRRGAPHENIKYSGRVDERDMGEGRGDSKSSQSTERERDRDRDNDRDRDRDRDRDKERERDRDRERDRERDRTRDRDRDRDRDEKREKRKRSRSRDRDKEREEKREKRKRSRSRERKRDRSKDRKDRDRKDRDRDREERRSRKEKDKSYREYDGESERKKSRMESEEEGQIVENNGREMDD